MPDPGSVEFRASLLAGTMLEFRIPCLESTLMTAYAPQTQLETHEVTNVPPPLAGRNLYAADAALRDAARAFGGEWVEAPLMALGAAAGSEEAMQWGEDANRYPPELADFRPLRRGASTR